MDDVSALLTNPALLNHPLILAGLAAALVQAVKIIWPTMPGDYLRLFACLAGILVVWLALDPPAGLAARKWFLIVISIGISVGTSAIGGVQTVKEVANRVRNGSHGGGLAKAPIEPAPPAAVATPVVPPPVVPPPVAATPVITPTGPPPPAAVAPVPVESPVPVAASPPVPAASETGPGGPRWDPTVPWPTKRP